MFPNKFCGYVLPSARGQDGVEYHFVSRGKMEEMIANGSLAQIKSDHVDCDMVLLHCEIHSRNVDSVPQLCHATSTHSAPGLFEGCAVGPHLQKHSPYHNFCGANRAHILHPAVRKPCMRNAVLQMNYMKGRTDQELCKKRNRRCHQACRTTLLDPST